MSKLRHVVSIGLFVTILAVLGACAQTAPRPTMPQITFAHLPAYQLAAGQVRVDSAFSSSLDAPHMELRLAQPPEKVMRQWAADRLNATGGGSLARFVIVEASVLEYPLDTDGNITAVFTNEQALRYEAAVEGVLEIAGGDGVSQGSAMARVSRAITIPENATLNERELALFEMVEKLMRDFDARMDENIRAHLGMWLQ